MGSKQRRKSNRSCSSDLFDFLDFSIIEGEFKFMITVIDGLPYKFRIRIWNEETGEMIYDNLPGATDTANPETAIGSGAIVIHKDK